MGGEGRTIMSSGPGPCKEQVHVSGRLILGYGGESPMGHPPWLVIIQLVGVDKQIKGSSCPRNNGLISPQAPHRSADGHDGCVLA